MAKREKICPNFLICLHFPILIWHAVGVIGTIPFATILGLLKRLIKREPNRGTNPPCALKSTNRYSMSVRESGPEPGAYPDRSASAIYAGMQDSRIYERNHQAVENKGEHHWEANRSLKINKLAEKTNRLLMHNGLCLFNARERDAFTAKSRLLGMKTLQFGDSERPILHPGMVRQPPPGVPRLFLALDIGPIFLRQ